MIQALLYVNNFCHESTSGQVQLLYFVTPHLPFYFKSQLLHDAKLLTTHNELMYRTILHLSESYEFSSTSS